MDFASEPDQSTAPVRGGGSEVVCSLRRVSREELSWRLHVEPNLETCVEPNVWIKNSQIITLCILKHGNKISNAMHWSPFEDSSDILRTHYISISRGTFCEHI